MRDWIRNVVVYVGFSLVPVTLGIDQCQPQEVCDGIENDSDGQIDEDFDEDSDGYLDMSECSNGNDCNDSDSSILPNAAEPEDGIDNDCDGQVDEVQQLCTLQFHSRFSEVPMAGIPVWLGLDGSGPVFYSDEVGMVGLYLENPVVDWSFGYACSTSFREIRSIYSFLTETLAEERTVYVYDPNLLGDRRDLSGTITGVDTTVASSVFAVSGGS